jgi:hypothetical protein
VRKERKVLAEQPPRLTLGDLEVMRRKRGSSDPYNVSDDLRQVRIVGQLGFDLGEWAKSRGVPREYAEALRRYLEQERLWNHPEEFF